MTQLRLLLQQSLQQCQRLGAQLAWSRQRVEPLFPLTVAAFAVLEPERLEQLDAFCLRYGKLQDMLGKQLFRAILRWEQEDAVSMLDCLYAMEKRGIVSDAEQWGQVRILRNRLAHEYSPEDEEKVHALNAIISYASLLDEVLQAATAYTTARGYCALK